MIININAEEVTELVLKKIYKKENFCLTRIGDGEISALNYKNFEDGANHFYKVHLGRRLADNHVEEISNNLKKVIEFSDVIGIPNEKDKLKNKYWGASQNLIKKFIKNKNQLYCDMSIHYHLYNKNNLELILKNVNNVTIISSRDVVKKLKDKYPNIKNINFFKIPGEFKYEEDKKYENYYPDIYNKIYNSIKKMDCSGQLLLLGGGFVGKSLGLKFSNQGGVSLDIGSVFDLFVGKVTRGPGKGANKYREPGL